MDDDDLARALCRCVESKLFAVAEGHGWEHDDGPICGCVLCQELLPAIAHTLNGSLIRHIRRGWERDQERAGERAS